MIYMSTIFTNPLWVALGGNGLGQELAYRLVIGAVAALDGGENGQRAHGWIRLCKFSKRPPGRLKISQGHIKFSH